MTHFPGNREPRSLSNLITSGRSTVPAPYIETETEKNSVYLHPLRDKNDVITRAFSNRSRTGGGHISLSKEARILEHTGITAVVTYSDEAIEAVTADTIEEIEAFMADYRDLSNFVGQAVHLYDLADSLNDGAPTDCLDAGDEEDVFPKIAAKPAMQPPVQPEIETFSTSNWDGDMPPVVSGEETAFV